MVLEDDCELAGHWLSFCIVGLAAPWVAGGSEVGERKGQGEEEGVMNDSFSIELVQEDCHELVGHWLPSCMIGFGGCLG